MTDNITLRRAAEQARSAIRGFYNKYSDEAVHEDAGRAIDTLTAALAERPAKPEPVAWLRHDGIRYKCFIGPKDGSEVPLYTAPPAAATREPATVEQIVKAGGECAVVDEEYLLDFRDGWRAAERFHGITKGDKT